jgi:hypothetical protein
MDTFWIPLEVLSYVFSREVKAITYICRCAFGTNQTEGLVGVSMFLSIRFVCSKKVMGLVTLILSSYSAGLGALALRAMIDLV